MFEAIDKLLLTDIGTLLALAIVFATAGFALLQWRSRDGSKGDNETDNNFISAIVEQSKVISITYTKLDAVTSAIEKLATSLASSMNSQFAQQREDHERIANILQDVATAVTVHNTKAKEANDKAHEANAKTVASIEELTGQTKGISKSMDTIQNELSGLSEKIDQLLTELKKQSGDHPEQNVILRHIETQLQTLLQHLTKQEEKTE